MSLNTRAFTRASLVAALAMSGAAFAAGSHSGGHGHADEETAIGWAARASKALGGRIEVRAFQVPPGE